MTRPAADNLFKINKQQENNFFPCSKERMGSCNYSYVRTSMVTIVMLIINLHNCIGLAASSSSSQSNLAPSTMSFESQIRQALQLSQLSSSAHKYTDKEKLKKRENEYDTLDTIKTTHATISAWEQVLYDGANSSSFTSNPFQNQSTLAPRERVLPPTIKILGHIFYGHALTQCGRDTYAEVSYQKAINLLQQQSTSTSQLQKDSLQNWIEAGNARGRCLQRLLRYDEARDQFDACINISLSNTGKNYVKFDHKMVGTVVLSVTCSLRLGNYEEALSLLKRVLFYSNLTSKESSNDDYLEGYEDLYGLYATCLWVHECCKSLELNIKNSFQPSETVQKYLELSIKGSNPSLIYTWLYNLVKLQFMEKQNSNEQVTLEQFQALFYNRDQDRGGDTSDKESIRLAAINQCPFDSPKLFQLDHKVHLHDCLMSKKRSKNGEKNVISPEGFVFPRDLDEFERKYLKKEREAQNEKYRNHGKGYGWILKHAAGYGSHGNQLVTASEALQFGKTLTAIGNTEKSSILCQKVVYPPLLLGEDGRKFSLRVYVILITPPRKTNNDKQELTWHVYLSKEGLVKVASSPFEKSPSCNDPESLNSIHMTNSGRESSMQQYDFDYLKEQFQEKNIDYDLFMSKIKTSVQMTLNQNWKNENFDEENSINDGILNLIQSKIEKNDIKLGQLCIPKILGLDFIVDSEGKPWLLEVNRFPGLEPRDECDYRVKTKVVEDAWDLAAHYACDDLVESLNTLFRVL